MNDHNTTAPHAPPAAPPIGTKARDVARILHFLTPQQMAEEILRLDYASKCVSAARTQALQEAYDALFKINGCKVTRFDAQTAIRKLMEHAQ